jgi:hypothetical protein
VVTSEAAARANIKKTSVAKVPQQLDERSAGSFQLGLVERSEVVLPVVTEWEALARRNFGGKIHDASPFRILSGMSP